MRERPRPSDIPAAPGSYQFVDAHGRVLYVGKAKSLRARLSSYLADPATLPPKTSQLVVAADHVEWIRVANEVEAILLEYALIKEHRPRFNIRLVDDKSYPWLAVTLPDQWPRAAVVRGRRRPGIRYFGPFAHVGAVRGTLDLVLRSFPVRTCSDHKLERQTKLGRPCLLYHIERCSGPCIGAVEPSRYAQLVDDLMAFFAGATEEVETRLESGMKEAAAQLDFEKAARLRDQLGTLRQAVERQQVVSERGEDFDVIGLADDVLEAAVCVFHVRRGRVVGRRSFVLDKVEELSTGALVGRVLEELYAGAPDNDDGPHPELQPQTRQMARPARRERRADQGLASGASDPSIWGVDGPAPPSVPRLVLVPDLPEEATAYEKLLASGRDGAVSLRVPKRGGRRALMETVTANAAEELARHRLRRASDHDARARAMAALQEHLALPQAPLRIECYDMSHLQGSAYVGSMVVFEDGLPRKSEYRRFKIRDVPGNDDYAAMEEVLTRRLTNLLEERVRVAEGTEGRRRRFSYPPQLLLVDGGKGQLGVASKVIERLGLGNEIPVAALAKALEQVYVPGRFEPVDIPRGSDALYLLQQIRDEAHRFAITYHRQVRGRKMTTSSLDGIPGLGPVRQARLIKEMGSIRAIRAASRDDLLGIPWLPDRVGEAVWTRLHEGELGHGRLKQALASSASKD